MGFMGQLYEHHSIVLLIVLLQIQLELFGIARVYRSRHPFFSFGQQSENSFIHEVINEDNSLFGTTNQLRHITPGIPHATCSKDLFRCHRWSQFIHALQNLLHLLVSKYLMLLQSLYALKHTCIG